jgi:hypothetical protein
VAETDNQMNDAVRMFIIQSLAAFDTPSQVAEAVKDEFGITISRQAVHAYDPTKAAGKDLQEKWRTLFEESRAAFLDNVADIPIANKAMRLRALQRMASKAEGMKNLALAARLHEQAAKEVGNAYTNKVDHTSSDGSMSPPTLADFYANMRQPKPAGEATEQP